MKKSGTVCRSIWRGFHFLKCEKVKSEILLLASSSPIDEVTFSFKADRLISASLLKRNLSWTEASNSIQGSVRHLKRNFVKPTNSGSNESLRFEYGSNSISFEYSNYFASIKAVKLPRGILLKELYASINK